MLPFSKGSRSDWINHTCTHALDKGLNSKPQCRQLPGFQKELLIAVGYGPYTGRGEMHWIATAYIVLQILVLFQGQIALYTEELTEADHLQIHTLNFIIHHKTLDPPPVPTQHIYGHPTSTLLQCHNHCNSFTHLYPPDSSSLGLLQ